MAPLDGTSAARSAVATSRLSASESARRVTSVGCAARSSGRRAAIGLAAVGTYVVANEKLWNGREVKLEPSAWTLAAVASGSRSEEHTSELQSPCNLVCRLLLEKKKSKVRPKI